MIRVFRVTICLLLLTFSVLGQKTYGEYYEAGMAARDSGDVKGFLENMQSADSLRPLHPTILFRLGCAFMRDGRTDSGLNALRMSLMLNATLPLEVEEDLSAFRETEQFNDLIVFRDSLLVPVITSEPAMVLDERDLHVEGLARDNQSGDWYFGSVHKRKIVRRDPNGKVSDFRASGEDGLMAVMGMAVSGRTLWVASVPAKEMTNYDHRGPSAVHAYDLDNGQLVNTFTANDEREHWFGDLVVDKAGSVFLTDSYTNEIYSIDDKGMHVWLDLSAEIESMQGIDADENYIYISDYLGGIYRIGRSSRKTERLKNPFPGLILKGADGLTLYHDSLIITINGQVPNKVLRLKFDYDEFRLLSYDILDRNHPDFGEPTLGVMVDDTFYYVGNSSWGAYKNGVLQEEGLPQIKILAVNLD